MILFFALGGVEGNILIESEDSEMSRPLSEVDSSFLRDHKIVMM